jgi:hypothetical protein
MTTIASVSMSRPFVRCNHNADIGPDGSTGVVPWVQ